MIFLQIIFKKYMLSHKFWAPIMHFKKKIIKMLFYYKFIKIHGNFKRC